MISLEDCVREDALGLAALVRGGAVSPEELVELAIARIEAPNAVATPLRPAD